LFTEGWHAVTHLRVAEEAGVGRATMYRHWPTVEDLLTDVLVDCQEPWEAGESTGDLRADLIAELETLVGALQHSKLPEIMVAAMERAPSDPQIRAMHDSMTRISRGPVWTVVEAAIENSQIDAGLDEPTAAAHTLGPHPRPDPLPVPLRHHTDHKGRHRARRRRLPRRLHHLTWC